MSAAPAHRPRSLPLHVHLWLCALYLLRVMSAMEMSSTVKPKIKIQLDSSWRNEMEGRPVVDGEAAADALEARVFSGAQAGARAGEILQTEVLDGMTKMAINQAAGQTTAPPPRAASSRSRKRSSSSGSSSAEVESGSRTGRKSRSHSKPPGTFDGPYPMTAYKEYKVKFAQVIDDMRFNLEELSSQLPRARMQGPTILQFRTRAPEARVVENVDDIIPVSFRVYYHNGVFSIRMPKQKPEQSTAPQASSRRRGPRGPTQAPQRLPAPAARSAPLHRSLPQRAPPKRRKERLVFRSGDCASGASFSSCPKPSGTGCRSLEQRGEPFGAATLGSSGASAPSDLAPADGTYRRHRLKWIKPRTDFSWRTS